MSHQVWLDTKIGEGADPKIEFAGDSDAHIVRGLIAVLFLVVDDDAVLDLDDAVGLATQFGCPGTHARPGVVMYRRNNDPARSIYAITANVPLQGAGLFPSVPGIDRAKLPTFLSAWQPEITMERLGGK